MSRVPFYCSMLRNGRADGAARPAMKSERGATCLIDNADALPYESCAWAIPAWGGKKALFGTNPVAFVFPMENSEPLVIDLALTTVVRGKIMLAMQKGETIPEGWALDRHGKPTTDPKEAIERGSLFPIGGAKGAMLADEGVRLPGARRFSSERRLRREGIEVSDELLARIGKLAHA